MAISIATTPQVLALSGAWIHIQPNADHYPILLALFQQIPVGAYFPTTDITDILKGLNRGLKFRPSPFFRFDQDVSAPVECPGWFV